jgi:hypothetical protein
VELSLTSAEVSRTDDQQFGLDEKIDAAGPVPEKRSDASHLLFSRVMATVKFGACGTTLDDDSHIRAASAQDAKMKDLVAGRSATHDSMMAA